MSCPTTVHNNVCVEAEVTITPDVEVGEIRTFCVGDPFIGGCPVPPQPSCSFMVSQNICVQIPLTFDANASAESAGIACSEPGIGGCSQQTGCTYTIGFFRNNPEVTNALIEDAGGSIVLGSNSSGLSFTVTTSNANDVLDFNTPSPPAPEDPPFAAQYQVLYAQLLAANLNVLNGATCDFASLAIAEANMFIATSPEGGTSGAPAVQEPLAQFNEGIAPGCPEHCE